MLQRTKPGLVAALLLVAAASPAASASFIPVGDLPGGGFQSAAFDVSPDGSVVVGIGSVEDESAGVARSEAFRWDAVNGMVGLGDVPGGSSSAAAVSADGSIVVGSGLFPPFSPPINPVRTPFRWTEASGYQPLVPYQLAGSSTDVSADGTVVVGTSSKAFRWTQAGGIVLLGQLSGHLESNAQAVSADGSIVVGTSSDPGFESEAFRWDPVNGMVGLGDLGPLSGGTGSLALAISSNGSFVVGQANINSLNRPAFRWTEAEGMISLSLLPGDTSAAARGVSSDGMTVVGSGDAPGPSVPHAFLWTPAHGMRLLKDVLEEDYGLALDGWELYDAYAISDDGRVIVGSGLNPNGDQEGWVAIIPEPSSAVLLGGGLAALAARRRSFAPQGLRRIR